METKKIFMIVGVVVLVAVSATGGWMLLSNKDKAKGPATNTPEYEDGVRTRYKTEAVDSQKPIADGSS